VRTAAGGPDGTIHAVRGTRALSAATV